MTYRYILQLAWEVMPRVFVWLFFFVCVWAKHGRNFAFFSPSGPGAMHDVNRAAVLPQFSLCTLLMMTFLYLMLEFWCFNGTTYKLLSALKKNKLLPCKIKGRGEKNQEAPVVCFEFSLILHWSLAPSKCAASMKWRGKKSERCILI